MPQTSVRHRWSRRIEPADLPGSPRTSQAVVGGDGTDPLQRVRVADAIVRHSLYRCPADSLVRKTIASAGDEIIELMIAQSVDQAADECVGHAGQYSAHIALRYYYGLDL